jgi:hypothetical protein
MRNNRRGFVIGGAAGLTGLLAPNVAQACFCRRCRHASVRPTTCAVPALSATPLSGHVITFNSIHCPTWGGITLPPGILQPNTSYPFITSGTGLYAAYLAGAVFSPLIIDYNNLSSVSWGSYWHGPVVPGSGGNPDTLTINSAYIVASGTTPNSSGILTITVTITSPPNGCGQGSWQNQLVTYSS